MATPPDFVAGQVLTAAQMNAIGLWVTKTETTFTAASSVVADNVFNADYRCYTIIIEGTASADLGVNFRLRTGGVSAATNYSYQNLTVNNTTVTATRTASTIYADAGALSTVQGSIRLNLYNPFVAVATTYDAVSEYNAGSLATPQMYNNFGNHSTATSYDGIELVIAGGNTITGRYTIYGWNK